MLIKMIKHHIHLPEENPIFFEGMANPSSLHCSSSGCEPRNPVPMKCTDADASSSFLFKLKDVERNDFELVFDVFFTGTTSSCADFRNRSVAASQESSCLCLSASGEGSSDNASSVALTKPLPSSYVLQFWNCMKNSFDGWLEHTTILPIASASAVVVQTTSVVLGFRSTL